MAAFSLIESRRAKIFRDRYLNVVALSYCDLELRGIEITWKLNLSTYFDDFNVSFFDVFFFWLRKIHQSIIWEGGSFFQIPLYQFFRQNKIH